MSSRLAVLVSCCMLLAGVTSAAPDPAARCTAARIKAAAKKTDGKLKCQAVAAAHAIPVDTSCLTKVVLKFSAALARAEAKGGCAPLARRRRGGEQGRRLRV
jgi:hypothetical protein